MTSRVSSENGIFSVMHSNISIANENVSEAVVGEVFPRRISRAEYLTAPPDSSIEVALAALPSTIVAIPKSQISGFPLQAGGQPEVTGRWDVNMELTVQETSTFFCASSADRLS